MAVLYFYKLLLYFCINSKNQTIYNIIHLFARPMGETTHQPSVCCSKKNLFIRSFHFCNFIKRKKKEIERVYAKNLKDFMKKKIILGTPYAWLTSRLFHGSSKPAYYIVDWWILILFQCLWTSLKCKNSRLLAAAGKTG